MPVNIAIKPPPIAPNPLITRPTIIVPAFFNASHAPLITAVNLVVIEICVFLVVFCCCVVAAGCSDGAIGCCVGITIGSCV